MLKVKRPTTFRYKYTVSPSVPIPMLNVPLDSINTSKYVAYSYYDCKHLILIMLFVDINNCASEDYTHLGQINIGDAVRVGMTHINDDDDYMKFMPVGDGQIYSDIYELYNDICYQFSLTDVLSKIILIKDNFDSHNHTHSLNRVNILQNISGIIPNNITLSIMNGEIDRRLMPYLYDRYVPYEIHRNIKAINKFNEEMGLVFYNDLPTIHITSDQFHHGNSSEFYCVPYRNVNNKNDYAMVWYSKTHNINKYGGVDIFDAILLDDCPYVRLLGDNGLPKKVRTIESVSQYEDRFRAILANTSIDNIKNVLVNKHGMIIGKMENHQLMNISIKERSYYKMLKKYQGED